MNFVYPITNRELIKDICIYLSKKNERNKIMFMYGIYTGRRISDILKVKISDIKDADYIFLEEKKTKKKIKIKINPELKKVLTEYTKDKDPDDYLIKSRQGYNKPICRSMAYKILEDVEEKFGLSELGTHTLRKTFGYFFYKQYKDVALLMKIFGHTSEAYTLRYIGIEQESINKAMENLKIL